MHPKRSIMFYNYPIDFKKERRWRIVFLETTIKRMDGECTLCTEPVLQSCEWTVWPCCQQCCCRLCRSKLQRCPFCRSCPSFLSEEEDVVFPPWTTATTMTTTTSPWDPTDWTSIDGIPRWYGYPPVYLTRSQKRQRKRYLKLSCWQYDREWNRMLSHCMRRSLEMGPPVSSSMYASKVDNHHNG